MIDNPLKPTFIFSNKMEQLFEQLRDNLFVNTSAFSNRLLLVPFQGTRSWVFLQLAKDPKIQIAMGLKTLYLKEGINQLLTFLDDKKEDLLIPNQIELALVLELEIIEIITSFHLFNEDLQQLFLPLLNYLKIRLSHSIQLSAHSRRRLESLSEHLASLFLDYMQYASKMLDCWEKEKSKYWQQEIWKRIFTEKKVFSPINREIQNFEPQKSTMGDMQIHLFAFSFISKLHFDFFIQISKVIPVFIYTVSPCQMFWTDSKTFYEQNQLKRFWQKKGAAIKELEQLDNYLRDNNPLLANFSKVGREGLKYLEDEEAYIKENYQASGNTLAQGSDQPFLKESKQEETHTKKTTLLNTIQDDILFMRRPNPQHSHLLLDEDDSFQIHITCSKRREVEIMYHNLLRIIEDSQKSGESIQPSDIMVMAPNINEYSHHIRAIFSHSDSVLDYYLSDVDLQTYSPVIQHFFHFLNLSKSRLKKSELFYLFENPDFMRRHILTKEEVILWREWIDKSGIYWGEHAEHKEALLNESYEKAALLEKTDIGTWQGGFNQLIMALSCFVDDSITIENMACFDYPLEGIELTYAQSIGKLIYLFRSMRKDLAPLSDGTQLSLKEWSQYLTSLFESYFSIDLMDHRKTNDLKVLIDKINLLNTLELKEKVFPFSSIERHLNALLSQETINLREGGLQNVHFCSLKPSRALPAKVIYLMGMDEASYPRKLKQQSFNHMQFTTVDYQPSSVDNDRYLYLELILSARKFFMISYQGLSLIDQKKQSASLCITETLSYINRFYSFKNRKPTEVFIKEHPLIPFHHKYFDPKKKDFWESSTSHFHLAKAYYKKDKMDHPFFISDYLDPEKQISLPTYPEGNVVIDLKDLYTLSSNPLKFYFNKTLGMYLRGDSEASEDESFTLTHIDKSIMSKMALRVGVEKSNQIHDMRGQIPLGLFKHLAHEQIEQNVLDIEMSLESFEINTGEIFTIELAEDVHQIKQFADDYWLVPALTFDLGNKLTVTLKGHLKDVTLKGLVLFKKQSIQDIVKCWPILLAYCFLSNTTAFPGKNEILFTRDLKKLAFNGKELFSSLKEYIQYYFLALENPLPFLPSWVQSFYHLDIASIEKDIRSISDDTKRNFYNQYAKWIFKGSDFTFSKNLLYEYSALAKKLFFPLDHLFK